MKKQMIMIALMSAAVCMTGCGADVNSTAAQPGAAQETTTAATDAAEQAADPAQAAAADAAAPANADPGSNAEASADLQNIIGTWEEADVLDSRTLTVKTDGTYELAYRGGGAQYGTVKVSRAQHPDGSPDDWWNFYETDGTFWTGFQITAEAENDIYSGQDGAMHFVRASAAAESSNASSGSTPADAPDVSVLAGDWYYQEQDPQNGAVYGDAGFVTIQANGTYEFQPGNGSVPKHGTIKLDYEEYSNGDRVPIFEFIEDGGTFWNGIYWGQNEADVLYFGNGGVQRLSRRTAGENVFEDYIGTWQCDKCTIQIGEYGIVEIHWADSASEDNLWEYACVFSPDNTCMECLGGGTKTHIVTAEDGTETRTEIYNDGTATFRTRGDTLFWSDGKENAGMEMGFRKIG